mgnify:CR=1 FL=1
MPQLREQPHTPNDRDQTGFDAGHRSVLRNSRISAKARLAFVFINSYATTARQGCFLGNARLASYIGCSRRTVQRLIRELERVNAIEVVLLDYGHRQIRVTGHVIIGNEAGHDTDVIPPETLPTRPHDTDVTIGMDEGIDLRNKNKAAPAAGGEKNSDDEVFARFYDAYETKARYGNRKESIRKEWEKALAAGADPQQIIAAVELKKKRLAVYKANPKGGFEPNFPYPIKFLRNELWRSILAVNDPVAKREPATNFGGIDYRFRNIPPSFLHDLKRLKATDEQLQEINARWDYWQARKLNGEGISDQALLEEVQKSLYRG